MNKPNRVENVEEFWSDAPPTPSPRLVYWQARIDAGWRPNKRISKMGYYNAAEFFGVWIWEYINVIAPRLQEAHDVP